MCPDTMPEVKSRSKYRYSLADRLRLGNIPKELCALPQWVIWSTEERGTRFMKPPRNPLTGRYAKVTDPETWADFHTAAHAAEKFAAAGIGFVLTAKDPFIAVDLDHCRNPVTGEIKSWAQEIIEQLSSYTEVSPSGEGIHIWVRGSLPASGRKFTVGVNGRGGEVEMYSKRRYVTVTGRRLP